VYAIGMYNTTLLSSTYWHTASQHARRSVPPASAELPTGGPRPAQRRARRSRLGGRCIQVEHVPGRSSLRYRADLLHVDRLGAQVHPMASARLEQRRQRLQEEFWRTAANWSFWRNSPGSGWRPPSVAWLYGRPRASATGCRGVATNSATGSLLSDRQGHSKRMRGNQGALKSGALVELSAVFLRFQIAARSTRFECATGASTDCWLLDWLLPDRHPSWPPLELPPSCPKRS